jgi:hypothetical protein
MLLKKLQIVRIKGDLFVFKRDQVSCGLCNNCPYYSNSLVCTFIGTCRILYNYKLSEGIVMGKFIHYYYHHQK